MLFLASLLACRPATPADRSTDSDPLSDNGTTSSTSLVDTSAAPGDDTAAGAADTNAPGLLLDGITYQLTWNPDGVEILDGGGWRVTNDRGDTVEIHDGFLVTYDLHLDTCLSARHAGDDASSFTAPWIERLDTLRDQPLEPVLFDANRYCGAYYGVARADWTARNAPEDIETDSVSLSLTGRWWPEGGDPIDFEWSTALSNGWSEALLIEADPVSTLDIRRSPNTLFDGVDLSGDPDIVLRDVLENLVFGVRFIAH